MPEIATHLFEPNSAQHIKDQVYNGLDCCVTQEVFEALQHDDLERARVSYNFARAMQAPAMEMMLRGIRVDKREVAKVLEELGGKQVLDPYWKPAFGAGGKIGRVQSILDRFAEAVWGKGLNPRSHDQLKEFFYKSMGLPEQYKNVKGIRQVTTDRDALEKLQGYFHAEPIINCVLLLKDLSKKVSVLRTEIDPDGRMRTSYNVVGTETGRWSSSASAFNTGSNLQNITEKLRRIFIADKGYKLGYIDLSQAESRVLGWLIYLLFGDSKYLDACENGDLHTIVARWVWPHLGWTGDLKKDRAIAEQKFYRDFSYRDMAKRGGHGTNYIGTAFTMAKHLKVSQRLMEEFQFGYFQAFPGIPRFHKWVAATLSLEQKLTTILGRTRYFFGRSWDDATIREGVAFLPQSIVGELLNLALWRVWCHCRKAQILAQMHDAILFQYKEEEENEVLPLVRSYMPTPLTHNGRTMVIPSDIEVGWNWAKYNPKEPLENPAGMMKWTGNDERIRPKEINGLDHFLTKIQ